MKAVIFDVDGLLIDSEPLWNKARDVFMERKNMHYDKSIDDVAVGMGLREVILRWQELIGLNGETEELIKEYRKTFYEVALNEQLVLMPGARELINRLSSRSFVLAIATGGHTKDKVTEIIKNLNLLQFFKVLVSSDDVSKGKPAPDVYLKTAGQLGVDPQECVVLEDAVNGVVAGKSAGMRVIGINIEDSIRAELLKAGADEVYKSLNELNL